MDLVDEVIGGLYEATVDPAAWAAALDRLSDAFASSQIFLGSFAGTAQLHLLAHRADPRCARLLSGPLASAQANPFIASLPFTRPGRACLARDACGEAVFLQSRAYLEGLAPFGLRHMLGGVLESTGMAISTVALARGTAQGNYTRHDVDALTRIMPHLARANHVRLHFAQLERTVRTLAATLDCSRQGTLLLDGQARLLFANRSARQRLAARDGIDLQDGRVRVCPSQQERFDAMLAAAFAEPASCGTKHVLALPDADDRAPLLLSMSCVCPDGRHGPCGGEERAVLVTLNEAGHAEPPPESVLREAYGLTGAEARLARCLCDGSGLTEAAHALGVSRNTVKTQFAAICAKLGATRQAEVVKRLLSECGGPI